MAEVDWNPAEKELIGLVKKHTQTMLATTILLQGADTFVKCSVMADVIKQSAAEIAALDAKHGEG